MGSSRHLNVSPEASISLILGQAVSRALSADPHVHPDNPAEIALAVATVITFQVGAFAFILGLLRLGFVDVILGRPLLRGFLAAIAIVILM